MASEVYVIHATTPTVSNDKLYTLVWVVGSGETYKALPNIVPDSDVIAHWSVDATRDAGRIPMFEVLDYTLVLSGSEYRFTPIDTPIAGEVWRIQYQRTGI